MSRNVPAPAHVYGLEPYVPRIVRDWDDAGAGERFRTVEGTLVSVDVSGFTRLSERAAAKGKIGAEEVSGIIGRCFTGLTEHALQLGGDVWKFAGDCILVCFDGAGHEHRAVLAAHRMRCFAESAGTARTSAGPARLRFSTGASTGRFLLFLVGSTHRELFVTGADAAAAADLEAAARPGEILLCEHAAASVAARLLGPARATSGGPARPLRRAADIEDVLGPAAPSFGAGATVPGTGRDLGVFLPVALAGRLGPPGRFEGEHRLVTAGFVRFGGVGDVLGHGGPDALACRLERLSEVVDDVTAAWDVAWLETVPAGDGGMLYLVAGAPAAQGDDEGRMLHAVRAILDHDTGLPVRAGVARGRGFVGLGGCAARCTYTVTGDTVNVAARLAAAAEPGELLATTDVLDRSRWRFQAEATAPLHVKGKRPPLAACRVGPAAATAPDVAGVAGVPDVPLIGRREELDAARAALDAAGAGHGALVDVVGPPGIGKSRLTDEICAYATEVGFALHTFQCEPYERATPYAAFGPLLRSLTGIGADSSPIEAGRVLGHWVKRCVPHLGAWLPLLGLVAAAETPPTPETERLDPSFRRNRLHAAAAAVLDAALPGPSMLVFHDVHWMDDASCDLLAHLATLAPEERRLLCITRRPGSAGFQPAEGSGTVRLALGPLLAADAALLASEVAAASLVHAAVASRLGERSGGNPLFVVELVRNAAGSGTRDEALPETVEALIAARIDTLAPEDRALLRAAAVVGVDIDLAVLEQIAPDPAAVADAGLWRRLDEFVRRRRGGIVFRHDLFRVAAYEGLSYRRRRELHGRVGAVLERSLAGLGDAAVERLSAQFHAAQDYARAWRYAKQAAEAARRKYANVDAAELYARALDAGQRLAATGELAGTELVAVGEALGDVAELAGLYEAADNAYASARRCAAADTAAADTAARLLHKQGLLRERRGRYSDALRWYTRGIHRLDRADSPAAAVERVHLALAYAGVRYRQGRFAETIRWGREAAAGAEAIGDRASLAHAYYLLDAALTDLGSADAARYRELALPIFEEIGDLTGQGNVLTNLGIDAYYEGRWDHALDLYARARAAFEAAGDVVGAATAANNIAEVRSDRGDLDGATALFTEARRAFEAARYPVGAALATSNLGRAAARAGRFRDAEELLALALASFDEIHADSFVLETRARTAECLVLEGRHHEALAAIAAATDTGVTVSAVGALLGRLRGAALLLAGDTDAASDTLAAALEQAEQDRAEYEEALTHVTLAAAVSCAGDAAAAHVHRAKGLAILDHLGVDATARFVADVAGAGGVGRVPTG